MTIIEKYWAIKYLKNIVVKHQKYEFATWLRDKERSILLELGEVEDYSYTFEYKLNYKQYHYVIELISTYKNLHNHNEQQFVEMIKKEHIHLIRDEKIDELLG